MTLTLLRQVDYAIERRLIEKRVSSTRAFMRSNGPKRRRERALDEDHAGAPTGES